jgi:hypothetical protein
LNKAIQRFFALYTVTAMMDLTSFPLFSKLPQELQQEIWIDAWKEVEPRVIQLIFNHNEHQLTFEHKSHLLVHPLLQTCRNAVHVIARKFIKKLSTVPKGCVLFNPAVDSIYLGEGFDKVDAVDLLKGGRHVQSIVLGTWYWSAVKTSKILLKILSKFHHVEEITFISDERHPSKWYMEKINVINCNGGARTGLRFRCATCINTNGVIEFMDKEDEHKDDDEAAG